LAVVKDCQKQVGGTKSSRPQVTARISGLNLATPHSRVRKIRITQIATREIAAGKLGGPERDFCHRALIKTTTPLDRFGERRTIQLTFFKPHTRQIGAVKINPNQRGRVKRRRVQVRMGKRGRIHCLGGDIRKSQLFVVKRVFVN
jgi:hypothetical protein